MARYAELTALDFRRILFNPETVANFSAASAEEARRGAGTSILMTSSPYPALVRERPDEVLARLCGPVDPGEGERVPSRVLGALRPILAAMLAWNAAAFDGAFYLRAGTVSIGPFARESDARDAADEQPGGPWAVEFREADDVSGADLVDAFCLWRARIKEALV